MRKHEQSPLMATG